jgi:hypothetical protein
MERYEGGESRGRDERQLTQLGNAAWAAGLSLLMDGRRDESAVWLRRAADRYRESWDAGASSDSWGRPIAATKALLLAGDTAYDAAGWALDAGARDAESAIGRYAGVLALLVLGDDAAAGADASTLRGRDDFPQAVAESLAAIADGDSDGYARAVEDVLAAFEERTDFLENVRVADTVLALQVLASRRGLEADLHESELLPHR